MSLTAERLFIRLNTIQATITAAGGNVDLQLGNPATPAELAALPAQTPGLMVDILKLHSTGYFRWELADNATSAGGLTSGLLRWHTDLYEVDRDDYWWAEEGEAEDYDIVWRPALSSFVAMNGDQILTMLDDGSVMNFSHDQPEVYGRIVAPSFDEFMDLWSAVGFPWFELGDFWDFVDPESGCLDGRLEHFQKVQAALGT